MSVIFLIIRFRLVSVKQIELTTRITSYNVCYTKLLRKNELSVSSTSDDTTIDKSEHSVKQYMPQFIGIGLSYNTPKWTFSGDYKWIQWNKMESSQSIISYANQNLLKLGLAYTLGNPYRTPIKLMLGAGTSNSYVSYNFV